MRDWLTIGDFATLTGLTPRALRIYEELGLIHSVTRGENRYRYYDHLQFEAVNRIKQFKDMGFSLREIKALFLKEPNLNAAEVRMLFFNRLAAIDRQASDLSQQKSNILKVIDKLQLASPMLEDDERNYLMSQIEIELPFLAIRDVVMFPTQRRAIYIGREFSKESVKLALTKYKGSIVVATQKLVEMNDKPDADQVFETGCFCQILETVLNADGSIKIILEGKSKWHIVRINDQDSARFCKGAEIPADIHVSLSQSTKLALTDQVRKLAPFAIDSLQTAVGGAEFVARAVTALSTESIMKKAKRGSFLIDSLSADEAKNINLDLARIQEILAASDSEAMALKVLELWPAGG